jgi:hypothetical protein
VGLFEVCVLSNDIQLWNDYQEAHPFNPQTVIYSGYDRKLTDESFTKGIGTGCVTGRELTALIIGHDSYKYVRVNCERYLDI